MNIKKNQDYKKEMFGRKGQQKGQTINTMLEQQVRAVEWSDWSSGEMLTMWHFLIWLFHMQDWKIV